MKRIALVSLAAAAAMAGASAPAAAAPPEVSKRSCEAQGGTFSVEKGTKSCTTTTTQSFTFPEERQSSVEPTGAFTGVYYTGVQEHTVTTTTTTTQSQRGNGEVTTTEERTVTTTTEPTACYRTTINVLTGTRETQEVDQTHCASRGLYTT